MRNACDCSALKKGQSADVLCCSAPLHVLHPMPPSNTALQLPTKSTTTIDEAEELDW